MKSFFLKYFDALIFILLSAIFFYPFFQGLLPIPADTIVGLYHPFRDVYHADYPNGIPFKNFLITDPVRQLYPWKEQVVNAFLNLQLPLWNPYEMAGKPLLANFQSGSFYVFNLILLFKPFYVFWSIYIYIQVLLAGVFQYLYLRNQKLNNAAVFLGSVIFAFCGFLTVWLEWGNIGHTFLWLPLILLSVDKLFDKSTERKSTIIWSVIFLFSTTSSFFAGHLQTYFYIFLIYIAYFLYRLIDSSKKFKILSLFIMLQVVFIVITFVQWFPTLQFLSYSNRAEDMNWTENVGWFIPWQHLIQFLIPDFFGNPTTLNYWGVWNYAEFSGYIGVVPMFFVILGLIAYKSAKKQFFLILLTVSFIFALPTPVSKLIYSMQIPFISSAQPTRLISVVCFALSVISAFGVDVFLSKKFSKKMLFASMSVFAISFLAVWFVVFGNVFGIKENDLLVTKRNVILPTVLAGSLFLISIAYLFSKRKIVGKVLILLIFLIVVFDLFRFFTKFQAFSKPEYLYPDSRIINFLKKDKSVFRIAQTDSRILPPNFSTHYNLQSIEGYDPLYLLTYAEFIAAMERGDQSIKQPFGYNRIVTPRNINSTLFPYLNVKYVLSLTDVKDNTLRKVMQEGETRLYEYTAVLPRAFFVDHLIIEKDPQLRIYNLTGIPPLRTAVLDDNVEQKSSLGIGEASIKQYSANKIQIYTRNVNNGFLVLLDVYYPTWTAYVDGVKTRIYKTNHTFRGVYVPKGSHVVEFKNNLF